MMTPLKMSRPTNVSHRSPFNDEERNVNFHNMGPQHYWNLCSDIVSFLHAGFFVGIVPPTFKANRTLQQIVKASILLWAFSALLVLFYFRMLSEGPFSSGNVVAVTGSAAMSAFGNNDSPKGNFQRQHPFIPNSRIPLPLPKKKVSVVIMNYSRPRMIRESTLMSTLISHPNVNEILLLHTNPKTKFQFVHDKVKNIDAFEENDEMGLSLRFYFCQMAKNDWVMHVDDDMEFSYDALSDLFIEFSRDPKRIVGRFGRNEDPSSWFNGYSSAQTQYESDVVLTKMMVLERDLCSSFFEYAHLIWDDVVIEQGEGPLWNGEDIFMSLVANYKYGRRANYAMKWLPVYDAPESLKDYDNGKLDISGGMTSLRIWDWHWWQSFLRRNRHYSYRGKLWRIAKARFEKLKDTSKTKQ